MENTCNATGEHKIFVASSLLLQKQREAVEAAINQFNEINGGLITFSCVRYENYPDILQVADKKDAQSQIDEVLRQSSVFFLIIQHAIKPLTRYEFEEAWSRFRNNELPRYIFVFHQREDEIDVQDDDAVTFNQLLKKYTLYDYQVDAFGELVPHLKVYDIPFNSQEELTEKILEQLKRMPGKLPPARAKFGDKLVKDDFFTDTLRKVRFPDLFFQRPIDAKLFENIKENKMVLVTGSSLSGKTRSVMEALKKVMDGWVFVIGDRTDGLINDMQMLRRYIQVVNHMKLYIEIDNLDQHVGVPEIRSELHDLINAVMEGADCTIVATASNYSVVQDALQLQAYQGHFARIEIKKMKRGEFIQAIKWFKNCGEEKLVEENAGYNQLGALFVDLGSLKLLYNDFMKKDTIVRQSLLKSIKAQSIWRGDAFGDKEMLRSMTEFFVKLRGDATVFREDVYESAKNALCNKGLLGVSEVPTGSSKLFVEEYVYRYVIGYDGGVLSAVKDTMTMVRQEKELIKDILMYCYNQRQEEPDGFVGRESITSQVSKIMRRCDHPFEVTRTLYDMWWNGTDRNGSDLAKILKDDREECQKKCEIDPNEKEAHFYSGVVKQYLLLTRKSRDFSLDDSISAYEKVPGSLRVDELFASLMLSARTPKERDRVRILDDYKMFGDQPCTVLAEMDSAVNYIEAKELFLKVKNPCEGFDSTELAEQLLDNFNKPYNLYFYGRMLRKLALFVRVEEEFDDLCELIRENFMCLISDNELLHEINDQSIVINKDTMTLIDQMGFLGEWASIQCAINVYGDNLESCERLESKLISCIKATLEHRLISEIQLRMIVSTICARLINAIAEKTDYEEVYNTLFVPLEMVHPDNGRKLILRNAYTYTVMMKCRGADVRTSMNLFANDLIRHVHDTEGNHLSVTCYMLNSMLFMCKNERRIYLDQINNLYDKLGIARDIFAYNILIEVAADLHAVNLILKKMKDEGVYANIYTYINIIKNDNVDFKSLLWLLNCSDCLAVPKRKVTRGAVNKDLKDILPNSETLKQIVDGIRKSSSKEFYLVKRMLRQMDEDQRNNLKIQQILHLIRQPWIVLFGKPIEVEEKDLYEQCLKHLQEKHPEFIGADNRVYNPVLRNETFIVDFKEVLGYINKKLVTLGFTPNGYTADVLLSRVLSLRGVDRRIALSSFNEFLKSYPSCLTYEVIIRRIRLFRKQDESLELVFFDADGRLIVDDYSPLRYLRAMNALHLPLNASVIMYFAKIRGVLPKNYSEVAEYLSNQEYYSPNSDDIRSVREQVLPFCNNLPEVYGRTTPMIANKNIAWNFKQTMSKNNAQRSHVMEALDKLDWSDANSALCALNDILTKFILLKRDDNMFDAVYGIYKCYVIDNPRCVSPTSFTLNLLAKAMTLNNVIEKRPLVFSEIRKWHDIIIIHPHLLIELARTVKTVEELIQVTRVVQNLGCKSSLKVADTYVFYLNCNLLHSDPQSAKPILCDLLHYVFGEDEKDRNQYLLEEEGRAYLMLDYYKESGNFSEFLLHTLLLFNHNLDENDSNKYSVVFLVKRLLEIVPSDTIAGLMTLLVADRSNIELAKEYVPRLFDRRRNYSDAVLQFLSEQLPKCDLDRYNQLLEKFYTFKCSMPESVVPILLHRQPDCMGDPELLQRQRKVYVHIIVGMVRQGDLLMERKLLPSEYASWCHRSLEDVLIRDYLGEYGISIYAALIRLFYGNKKALIKREYWAFTLSQERLPGLISRGELGVREIEKLPDIWSQIKKTNKGWEPNHKLVQAVIRAYASKPCDSAWCLWNINLSIASAEDQKNPMATIKYKSLGRLTSWNNYYILMPVDELIEFMPHQFIIYLCGRLVHKDRAFIADEVVKDSEALFVDKLNGGEIDMAIFDELPNLACRSGWCLSPELRTHLVNWFTKKNYFNLMQYISRNKMIKYSDPENSFFLEAVGNAEIEFVSWIKGSSASAIVKLRLLDQLPKLWSNAKNVIGKEWNPCQELVLAMIGFYASVPHLASRQIASVSYNVFARNKIFSTVSVRYSSLGAFPYENCLAVKLPAISVLRVMPHQYIVSLCRRIVKKEDDEMVIALLRKQEEKYVDTVKKGKIEENELFQLPLLWKYADWEPSVDLRQLIPTHKSKNP